jgi:hypothetical protein
MDQRVRRTFFVQQVFYVVKCCAAEAIAGVKNTASFIEGIEAYIYNFSF